MVWLRYSHSSRAMRRGSSAGLPAPPGDGTQWGSEGLCPAKLEQMYHPTVQPRAFTPHGLPSSQCKSWDRGDELLGLPSSVKAGMRREDQHLGAFRGLSIFPHGVPRMGCVCVWGVCPFPHYTKPIPSLPSRLLGEGAAWKRSRPHSHNDFPISDSAQEQDLQSRDAPLLDLQYSSDTFSPLFLLVS